MDQQQSIRKRKTAQSVVALIAAILLFFGSGLKIPGIEKKSDQYFIDAIKKAGLAYATCRLVNASVSVLKDSRLELEPAGVGVSLALGQVLDPIDDMTERLSDLLVIAITALGVQKLVYEITQGPVLIFLSVLMILLSVCIWIDGRTAKGGRQLILGLILIAALLRMTLPLSALVNAWVQQSYFDDRIARATTELKLGLKDLDELNDMTLPDIEGIKGTLENSARFLKEKSKALQSALSDVSGNMGLIIENLLTLTFLYTGIFCIQVLCLPLLTFWLLYRISRIVFETPFSAIINPSIKGDDHAVREH